MIRKLLSTLPFEHIGKIPQDSLSAALPACRSELFTGLLRAGFDSGDLLMTFVQGRSDALYLYQREYWSPLPEQYWAAELERPCNSIHRLPVSVDGMRVCRVFLNAPATLEENMTLGGNDLRERLKSWSEGQIPGMAHALADGREILVLLAGIEIPVFERLSISSGEAQFFVEYPEDLPVEDDGLYDVNIYSTAREQDILQEYGLRLSFGLLMRLMIHRFGDMAGYVFAQHLCAWLTELNYEHGWQIELNNNGILHKHLFKSLEDACHAYSFILERFLDETGTLVGPRLAKEVADTSVQKLGQYQRELLLDNLPELQAPEINLSAG